ncbi:MAG: hypothetical protein IKH04_10600 [Kiritimatiellae bacterium]|nr:hypothetical protein [Kiritimatiellia bacterium]
MAALAGRDAALPLPCAIPGLDGVQPGQLANSSSKKKELAGFPASSNL